MAVTVTNSTIAKFDAVAAVTANAATADTNGLAEVFAITPTRAGHRCLLLIGGTGSAAAADIAFSIPAGEFWAGTPITGTVTKNTEKIIELETAHILKNDGTFAVTLTPGESDKLKTTHGAYVKFFELL